MADPAVALQPSIPDPAPSPSSSQARNPGEWLPGPGSAEPIACDGPQGRPGGGGRDPGQSKPRMTEPTSLDLMSLLDQCCYRCRSQGGTAGAGACQCTGAAFDTCSERESAAPSPRRGKGKP